MYDLNCGKKFTIDRYPRKYNQIYWEFHKWRSLRQIEYQVFCFELIFWSTFFLLSDFCNQTQIFQIFCCIPMKLFYPRLFCGHVEWKKSTKREITLQSKQPAAPTTDVMYIECKLLSFRWNFPVHKHFIWNFRETVYDSVCYMQWNLPLLPPPFTDRTVSLLLSTSEFIFILKLIQRFYQLV